MIDDLIYGRVGGPKRIWGMNHFGARGGGILAPPFLPTNRVVQEHFDFIQGLAVKLFT